MEIAEKVRIIQAAVKVAAAEGFELRKWYHDKLNLELAKRMTEEDTVRHMCCMSMEQVLIYDNGFSQKLFGKNWKNMLRRFVVQEDPMVSFSYHLSQRGVL